ncbi:MAG: hypothetical protein J6P72_11425 [Firmicutes bacterium]|nr:hypothetical protein [Bacillota bacterium]
MSQYYNTAAYPNAYQQSPTPGQKALKNSFGGTLYLIATILFTVTLVIELVSSFLPGTSIAGTVMNLLQTYSYQMGVDIPSEVYDVLPRLLGTSFFSTLIGMIPSILVCLGMWLLWASARAAKMPSSTAGYTILQVMAIISLVGACLGTLLVLVVGVIGLIGISAAGSYMSSYGSSVSTAAPTTVLIIVLLIALIVMVLVIIYHAKLASIYSTCKDVLSLNRAGKKISMYVIVFNFISIFFSIIGSISTIALTTSIAMLGGGFLVLSGISTILGILVTLFETLTFVKARGEFASLQAPVAAAGYGSYNFETGAYNTGSYQTAGYQAPYQTGSYNTQNQNTGYQQNANAYQQQNAAYSQNAYQQPSYDQNAYQQPSYDQNAYQQPSYDQNAYQQPSYDQNAYQQPSYDQNAYQQPQDNQQDVWSSQGQNQDYYGGQ